MKINAKTSYDQLTKYAFLHSRAAAVAPGRNRHGLIYLSRHDWNAMWKGQESLDIEGRRRAALAYVPEKLGMERIDTDPDAIRTMLLQMRIAHLKYDDLATILTDMRAEIIGPAWQKDVLYNLLTGAVEELKQRRLTDD